MVVTDEVIRQAACEDAPVKLVAVCDPFPQNHAERCEELREKGVAIFDSIDKLLATDCEVVWLPLPIELHRPATQQALAARKKVLVEKPAAASVEDVDAMIAARDKHRGF